jgi:hypothetical protein
MLSAFSSRVFHGYVDKLNHLHTDGTEDTEHTDNAYRPSMIYPAAAIRVYVEGKIIMIRTLLLIFGCISFIIVIGGATYEHAAVVPVWTSAVPASISMFQGEYGLTPWNFWVPVHPVAITLLTLGLIANWRSERRNYILTTLVGYLVILAITFVYFVPELLAIVVETPYSATIDTGLTRRANLWEILSLVRLGGLLVLAVTLLLGLSKPVDAKLK